MFAVLSRTARLFCPCPATQIHPIPAGVKKKKQASKTEGIAIRRIRARCANQSTGCSGLLLTLFRRNNSGDNKQNRQQPPPPPPTIPYNTLQYLPPPQHQMHACRDLERKTGLEVFVDMSVSETLYHLIEVGASGGVQQGQHGLDGPQMMAEATALQKRLKVPDKRFWHIKIKVCAWCGAVRCGAVRLAWSAVRVLQARRCGLCEELKLAAGAAPLVLYRSS